MCTSTNGDNVRVPPRIEPAQAGEIEEVTIIAERRGSFILEEYNE